MIRFQIWDNVFNTGFVSNVLNEKDTYTTIHVATCKSIHTSTYDSPAQIFPCFTDRYLLSIVDILCFSNASRMSVDYKMVVKFARYGWLKFLTNASELPSLRMGLTSRHLFPFNSVTPLRSKLGKPRHCHEIQGVSRKI